MGLLDQLFERRDASLSLTNYQQWVDLGIIDQTASGVSVTPMKALQHSAVYACVRILAETVASLPLIMYERLERGKRRATEHQLYELLKDRPNEAMTSFEYREALQGHLGLWGNAYSSVVYGPTGQVQELWPLRPDCMLQIMKFEGRWVYHYQLPSGETRWLDEFHVWHLRGMGSDGRIGYSPIRLMRHAIGLGMAAEEYGARFFSNDATAGVVLSHPKTLSEDAKKRIRESWEEGHQGLSKKHRMAILEEGMTAEKITIPPDDAQFLQTRKFQLQEIARMYRIQPHMLADLDRATFSNIEHQSIEFVIHTIRPWLVRWEQSIAQRLMLAKDRARYFPEFLVEGLLRGDVVSRYEAYAKGRQNGWLSANDIRELENMNPVKGGDVYLVPLNMVPATSVSGDMPAAGSAGARAAPAGQEERALRSFTYRRRLAHAHEAVFAQAAARVIRREVNDVRRAAGKMLRQRDLPGFNRWLDQFYADHASFVRREMLPVYQTFADLVAQEASDEVNFAGPAEGELEKFMREYVETYAARHTGSSKGQIERLLTESVNAGTDLMAALEQRFAEWESTRPGKIASLETVRSGNAVAKFAYMAAGVTLIRFIASGKSCPYCSSLDGKVISVESNFLEEGQDYQPEGADAPLAPGYSIGHPPVHDGCDCGIMADFGRALTVSVETRSQVNGALATTIMPGEDREDNDEMKTHEVIELVTTLLRSQAPAQAPMQLVIKSESVQVNDMADISPMIADTVRSAIAALPATRIEPIFNVPQAPAPTINVVPSTVEVKVKNEVKSPDVKVTNEIRTPYPKHMTEETAVVRDSKGRAVGTRARREYSD